MPKLGIRTRFTLILTLIFVVAILACWAIFSPLLQRYAENEIAYRAQLLIDTLSAVRTYTNDHIKPLLADDLATQTNFIKESVPAFSAMTVFTNFQSKDAYHDFSYKEATLNPTNPNDLADAFETQLVDTFRSDTTLKQVSGFTTRDGEQVFYTARPLSVSAQTCLACHSDPNSAPASLRNTYGTSGGFGWQMGQIVAAQTIYVPASDVFGAAQNALTLVMGVIVVIFAVVVVVTNVLLRRAVVGPIVRIARVAQSIRAETLTPQSPELASVSALARRGDEFGATATLISKMATEVYMREQQLKQEVKALRIQIDVEKQTKEVHEITDSDYFQNLQKRAHQLRSFEDESAPQPEPKAGEPKEGEQKP